MKPIELNRKYNPREIVKNEWILTTGYNEDYNYINILSLIKSGVLPKHLKQQNRKRPAYYVWGYEIAEYIKREGGILPELI